MASVRVVHINARVQWVFTQDAPSGRWVAVCEPLGLTVEGHTHAEMREHIDEALNLILRNMVQSGEIDRFLRDRGWQAQNMPPANQLAAARLRFDVPIELIAQRAQSDSARKAH
jgi:predicted RNase H-like HicB family nuclease